LKILPSILSADFAHFAADLSDVLGHCSHSLVGGDVIHVDVMDGHLVPNISFGPPVISKIRRAFPDIFFDVHLMIDQPVRYAADHRNAGADRITFHVEAPEVAGDIVGACRAISETGAKVGITLKPGTPLDAIFPALPYVDLVLIMSVEPGFGGQKFMANQLEKCRRITPMLREDQILEIDGGINPDTAKLACDTGVDWFVVGSAIFDAPDRRDAATQFATSILHP